MILGELFRINAIQCPEKIAVVLGDYRITYGKMETFLMKIAHDLLSQGISPGDRVALVEKTSIDCILLALGVIKTGAILVPINNLLQPRELRYILEDCEPSIIIYGMDYCQVLEDALEGLPLNPTKLAIGKEIDLERLREKGSQSATPLPYFKARDPFLLIYTAGTTGSPKAAIYSHENFWKNLLCTVIDTYHQDYDDIWIGPIPLYHIGGFATMMRAFLMRNTLILRESFDPPTHLETIQREGVTILYAYPTMINALVEAAGDFRFDLSSLRLVIYGGSPIPTAVLKKAFDVFSCDFVGRYGLTECCGAAISVLSPSDHRRAINEPKEWEKVLGSVGLPSLGTLIQIEDDKERALEAPGARGEIVAHLEAPMLGYWRKPDETAETLRDGWLYTGDIGSFDERGYLYLVDRKKDMIISGARNIYPREIEEVLYQHPAVLEAAVIGVPDDYWGESVKSIVALKPGHQATEEEIISFCKENLASYKKPRSVTFVDALPKNPGGKILKAELREPYWKGKDRRIH